MTSGLHGIQDKYKALRSGRSLGVAGLCVKVVHVAFVCPSMIARGEAAVDVHQAVAYMWIYESAFSPSALNLLERANWAPG